MELFRASQISPKPQDGKKPSRVNVHNAHTEEFFILIADSPIHSKQSKPTTTIKVARDATGKPGNKQD
jgi:hypothetical protein